MQLAETRAVVTGGASGLGAATASWLAQQGAQVTIFDRDPRGRDFAESIGAHFAETDVTDEASVTRAIETAAPPMSISASTSGCR